MTPLEERLHALAAKQRDGAGEKPRLVITQETVRHARAARVPEHAEVTLTDADGRAVMLPEDVQNMLLEVLSTVASAGSVAIEQLPEVLTSTRAAELLGVSRPTLMKWAREGRLPSHKVGSHTRFYTADVRAFRGSAEGER